MQRIYTRVPAGAFPCRFNELFFHYTTDYAASFSLTELQKDIAGWVLESYFGTYVARSFKWWNETVF